MTDTFTLAGRTMTAGPIGQLGLYIRQSDYHQHMPGGKVEVRIEQRQTPTHEDPDMAVEWTAALYGSGIDDFPSTYKGGMMNLDDAVQEAMVLLVSHIEREVAKTKRYKDARLRRDERLGRMEAERDAIIKKLTGGTE